MEQIKRDEIRDYLFNQSNLCSIISEIVHLRKSCQKLSSKSIFALANFALTVSAARSFIRESRYIAAHRTTEVFAAQKRSRFYVNQLTWIVVIIDDHESKPLIHSN